MENRAGRKTRLEQLRHVLGFGFRDKGYLPFYFERYRILSILLPGI